MLETIREYALERLAERGEVKLLRRWHAAYYLSLAEDAEPKLHGAEQDRWFDRLETEHDNIRTVLLWHETTDDVALSLRLASALSWFWLVRGYGNEGLNRLMNLLSHRGSEQPTTWRSKALNAAGNLSLIFENDATAEEYYQESLAISTALEDNLNKAYALRGMGGVARIRYDLARAGSLFEESLNLFRVLGDQWAIASTLVALGEVSWLPGEHRRATICYEESLAIYRKQEDRLGVAQVLRNMGNLMIYQDVNDARALYEESQILYRELRIAGGVASVLNVLGELARKQGDYARAATLYEESLTLLRELGEPGSIAARLHNLAYVAQHQNDYERGGALFVESLGLYRKLGNLSGIVICLAGLAGLAGARSQPERAARLFGAVEMLLEGRDAVIDPIDRVEYDRNLTAARAQFDTANFAAAWAEGHAMSLEQVIAYALSEKDLGTAAS
jgi:tetratricopeptide (TPR) repeat protein